MPLPSFEASYRTRDDLRVATFNNVDGPTEDVWARLSLPGCFRLTLTLNQLDQLQTLISKAKVVLDAANHDLRL